MPRQKNFKRLVRERMAKTGESYTAARAHFEPAGPRLTGDPDAAAMARALAGAGLANPVTGLAYSEELLFGLAGGINFSYLVFVYPGWTSTNLDGRFNTLYFEKKGFFETAAAHLGVPLRIRPTAKADSADKHLRQALSAATEVALTVDLVRMPGQETPSPMPYLPRTVTVASASEDKLVVTGLSSGRVTMGWDDVVEYRWTHNKKYGGLYVFGEPDTAVDLRAAVTSAIGRTAECLLEPSRSSYDGNFGVQGIRKWAELLTDPRDKRGWPKVFATAEAQREALDSVVRGLTGDGAGRRLYAAFLDEASDLLDEPGLAQLAETYRGLADRWADFVALAGKPDVSPAELAARLPELAEAEEAAARLLKVG